MTRPRGRTEDDMAVTELNHINIRTMLMEETKDFYQDIVGLSVGWRPPFGSHGYWMYCGDVPIVHLSLSDPEGDPRTVSEGTGNGLDHIGLWAEDIPSFEKTLADNKIDYAKRLAAGDKVVQMFFLDPNGVQVELQFDVEKEGVDPGNFERINVPGLGF
jgi:catechol 2,3-dioxygenase-like lactoylglutathione lyase family enzyme